MPQRILVIGATGMLGKPVAQQLKANGFTVRVLARSGDRARTMLGEGYEFAKGDYEDAASLYAAMQDCEGVHINIKGGPTEADYERADHLGVRRIAETAKAAGMGRVTLISSYALRPEIADEARAEIQKSGPVYFGWAGGTERGEPHYYRVQGKTFLLEYDNTQNDANHVHSVWRSFDGDFGRDLLGEHLKKAH